jgi:fermentation-respiration switch protein FrsA (DUF1100 family)
MLHMLHMRQTSCTRRKVARTVSGLYMLAAFLICPVARGDVSLVDTLVDELAGAWSCSIPGPGGDIFMQMDVAPPREASLSPEVMLTAPNLGIFDRLADKIRIDVDALVFEMSATGITGRVKIRSGEPPRGEFQFIEGPASLTELAPLEFDLQRRPDVRAAAGAVRHDGTVSLPAGNPLGITIVLAEIDGEQVAIIDIPAQGVRALQLFPADTEVEGTTAWRLPIPGSATLSLTPKGDTFVGTLRQGPLDLEATFERAELGTVRISTRPQNPLPPFPYEVREVVIPTRAGHELGGTLFVPNEPVKAGAPATVLTTGSGPQNRDEELMGHKPFLVLADWLARRGVATLRYDDRGVAASSGDFSTATTMDFADDAAAALAFMKTQSGIDSSRCGVAGHSEGGIVAAVVGAGMAPSYLDAAPAFVVSIAGTGVDGGELLKEQMKRIMLAAGIGEAEMVAVLERQARLIESVRSAPIDEAQVMSRIRALQEAQFELNGISPDEEMISQLDQQSFQQITSPWMLEFIRFDPSRAFERIKVPILAINGTLDVQVWHEQNLPAIEAAVKAGGGRVEIARFEGLNHLLQPAKTGSIDEYGIIDITMDEGPMDRIADFIKQVPPATTR